MVATPQRGRNRLRLFVVRCPKIAESREIIDICVMNELENTKGGQGLNGMMIQSVSFFVCLWFHTDNPLYSDTRYNDSK